MTTTTPPLVDKCRDIERVLFGDDLRVDTANRDHIIEAIHKSVIGGSYDWNAYEWSGQRFTIHRRGGNHPMSYYHDVIWERRHRSRKKYGAALENYIAAYRRPPRNFAADTQEGLWLCHRVLIPALVDRGLRVYYYAELHEIFCPGKACEDEGKYLWQLHTATPSQIVEAAWRAIGGSGDGPVSR